MSYLDVSPMIAALRDSPHDFEILFGRLSHIRSQHSFRFGPHGVVEVIATCECTLLAVSPAQGHELADAYCEWERDYWRPLLINREFASHFSTPSWRRTHTRQHRRLDGKRKLGRGLSPVPVPAQRRTTSEIQLRRVSLQRRL